MREFWNQKFSGEAYKYGEQPNAFLAEQAPRYLGAGAKVLVPGDGEGRNGVWLAEQGFEVTSLDCSDVGLAKAQDLAKRRGVVLQTVLADLTEWEPPAASFDAVAVSYLHLTSAQRPAIMGALMRALRPGGGLILEAFHPTQLSLSSGGPKDVDMLYTLEGLREDARACGRAGQELYGVVCETLLSEGAFHQGLARVTRWVWQAA